jgi:hypothetical protein
LETVASNAQYGHAHNVKVIAHSMARLYAQFMRFCI